MTVVSSPMLDTLWHDQDLQESALRRVVSDRLVQNPAPKCDDQIVGTYFFALRSTTLDKLAKEISYHATTGIKNPPQGTLLAECTGHAVGIDPFDAQRRIGLLHMAYPLKMFLDRSNQLTSVDLLHTLAGAIIFDVYENADARLLRIGIPDSVLKTFPGPAHGPKGLRRRTNFGESEPAFGTILKPTAGITPEDVGRLVAETAGCPLLMFIKEDENLYPGLPYSPVGKRAAAASQAIQKGSAARGGKGLIFAPHITSSPHQLLDHLHAALENGATGVMLSESFAGGAVRMVREATRHLSTPPAIYGHNAGIGVKCRSIWREVVDLLARLDGIDFRQTAPVRNGTPFIRPFGDEWIASEHALTSPLPGINPTMIARAGGLDQGNIILNLMDAEKRGLSESILFLAGSAINSVTDSNGNASPALGTEAMQQALDLHKSGELADVSSEDHLKILNTIAKGKGLSALCSALAQRYGQIGS